MKGKTSMPTQEERLGALEQSFARSQKEIEKSIRTINENCTILLGLTQSLAQDNKKIAYTIEILKIRVDQFETKVDAHTALLNEHTGILNEHTALLNEHTGILNEHTTRFSRLETKVDTVQATLGQILERLPAKS